MQTGTHQFAQIIDIGMAGIDDQCCMGGNRFQQVTLATYRFGQRHAFDTQRVFTPGLAEALIKYIIIGVQKQDFNIQSHVIKSGEYFRKMLQLVREITRIDTDRRCLQSLLSLAGQQSMSKRLQQTERQIIDTVITKIFQSFERDTFTLSGQTTDDGHLHALRLMMTRLSRCCIS